MCSRVEEERVPLFHMLCGAASCTVQSLPLGPAQRTATSWVEPWQRLKGCCLALSIALAFPDDAVHTDICHRLDLLMLAVPPWHPRPVFSFIRLNLLQTDRSKPYRSKVQLNRCGNSTKRRPGSIALLLYHAYVLLRTLPTKRIVEM